MMRWPDLLGAICLWVVGVSLARGCPLAHEFDLVFAPAWSQKASLRLQEGVPNWDGRAQRIELPALPRPRKFAQEVTSGKAYKYGGRGVSGLPVLRMALAAIHVNLSDLAASAGPFDLPSVMQRKEVALHWVASASSPGWREDRLTPGVELLGVVAQLLTVEQIAPLFASDGSPHFSKSEMVQRVADLVRGHRTRLWSASPRSPIRAELAEFFARFGDAADLAWVECAKAELAYVPPGEVQGFEPRDY